MKASDLRPAWRRGLPPRYVARPRLVRRLLDVRVGLVVAGAGYGKTSLADELAAELGLATVRITPGPRTTTPAVLAARVVAGLTRANLVDAANAVRAEQADATAAIDALAAALEREREPVLVILDDAHHLDRDATAVIGRLAQEIPEGHRLIILSRSLPVGLRLAGAAPTPRLVARDLAFNKDEVVALACAYDLDLSGAQASALLEVTAGWAAALVVLVERMGRSEGALSELAGQGSPLHYLLQTHLDELDPALAAELVQLSHLPLLSPAVAAAVTGDLLTMDRFAKWGIPIGPRADGWWELPGPIQELLQRHAPLSPATARAAAKAYVQAGELSEAVHILLRAGEADLAASLLAGASVRDVYDLGYLALQALVDLLPREALERHPRVLLQLARSCEPAAQTALRAETLERALSLAQRSGDAALERAVGAELCHDLVRDGLTEEARAKAEALLTASEGSELATRARLIDVLGRAAAWQRGGSLQTAERLLQQAELMYTQLGEPSWASQVAMPLAFHVYYSEGKHDEALTCIERTLASLPARSRTRGVILSFYGDILVDCGRFAEAEAAASAGRELGNLFSDHRISAYAEWTDAKRLSQMGDRQGTLERTRAAEAHWHDWARGWTGAVFLADVANLLDRVGEHGLALTYLERARQRRAEAPLEVAIGEAAVLARSGDPADAGRVLDSLEAMPRLERRDRWWVTLLRAYSAWRAGSDQAGVLAAQAFEQAAALGKPFLPLVRERIVAEQLIDLAVEAGSLAAAKLAPAERPVTISVLGHFEVRRAGELVPLPPGKPEQLVKFLAVCGGKAHVEVVLDALWPDAGLDSGRKRLRNVLNRLRSSAGELVHREGEMLALGPVHVDADAFESEARRLLEGGDANPRLVLAHYRGPLLPDERYEDWAAAPRERLERTFLAVLDFASKAAQAAGDVDEAMRYIDRAIEIEPYEESRYLRGARLLLDQGRRGSALSLLARGERALAQLGVSTSAAYRQVVTAAYH